MKLIIGIIRNKYIKWLMVVGCMLVIFAMSHLDSVKSWYMTGKLLTTVTQTQDDVADMDFNEEIGYYSADEQDFGMHLLRKSAHVIEFMVLFLVWVNALVSEKERGRGFRGRVGESRVVESGGDEEQVLDGPLYTVVPSLTIQRRPLILAALFTFLYAIFDEVHQLFIVGRTGTVGDVLIDSIGILIGLMVLLVARKITRRTQKSRECTEGLSM